MNCAPASRSTEAEARTRTIYANPSVAYSREGAGYNAFFEATQTLPVNSHIGYGSQISRITPVVEDWFVKVRETVVDDGSRPLS